MTLGFDQLRHRALGIDGLTDPPQGTLAGVRPDEILPGRNDPSRVGPHLRHVPELHAVRGGPQPAAQKGELRGPDDDQHWLRCGHALADEPLHSVEELVDAGVEHRFVTIACPSAWADPAHSRTSLAI